MIKALLAVRLRALLAAFTAQSRQKKKKSKGMLVLFAVLYVYVAAVIVGAMCLLFSQLAQPYHALGLDWLYFSMAGLMGLGFAIFASVFSTQSQLYDAKDNDLLLSMPIPPRLILLSRMIPLLLLNLLFAGLVMVPAAVMYAGLVEFHALGFVIQLLTLLAVTVLAQAVACLLGWLLHLLLSKINKSVASILYMVVFLGLYFYLYSQAGSIISAMALSGEAIASALKSWVWPLYALGLGCTGKAGYFLIFAVICAVLFGAVYVLLSKTFLRSATSRRSVRRGRLNLAEQKAASPMAAMRFKELRHFLGSPVYLTNSGIGILMTVALTVAGVIFRGKILETAAAAARAGFDLRAYFPLIICGILALMTSTVFVSAPSVSLEGKNLWILRSMPVSSRRILEAKLQFHMLLSTPVAALAGAVLAAVYGCGPLDVLVCALVPGMLTVLIGTMGMVFGLKWAKLDWISEAYPCKQGAAAGVTMLAGMGIPLALGGLYFLLLDLNLSVTVFLGLCLLLISLIAFGLYRLMVTWGVEKWESL